MNCPKYPDRWLDYCNIGKQIDQTQIFALKVPLKKEYFSSEDKEKDRFTPTDLVELVPNVGLIIDLTYTTKYYHPNEFQKQNVQYEKLATQGHAVPEKNIVARFIDLISSWQANEKNKDKLIGVHCTHGVNRTGYLVCAYMIQALKFDPKTAIKAFNDARSHTLERENYIQSLLTLKPASGLNTHVRSRDHTNYQSGIYMNNSNRYSQDRNRRHSSHYENVNRDRSPGVQIGVRNYGSRRDETGQRPIESRRGNGIGQRSYDLRRGGEIEHRSYESRSGQRPYESRFGNGTGSRTYESISGQRPYESRIGGQIGARTYESRRGGVIGARNSESTFNPRALNEGVQTSKISLPPRSKLRWSAKPSGDKA